MMVILSRKGFDSENGDNINRLLIILAVSLFLGSIDVSLGTTTEVLVSGSTTVLPLGEMAAEAFDLQQNEFHISVTGGGTGAGLTNIAEGRSNVAMASREVTTDEKEKYNDRFQEFLIAYDGIGVAVSKAIYDGGVKNLTRDQLKKIYAGEITKWSQLGGPDSDIYVIAREQGSGTLDTFNEVIMGNSKAETPGVKTIAMSSAEVKTAVTGSNKAIGYLGFSYIQGKDLDTVALDGKQMTVETIKDGSYSLARKLYLVTFGSPNPGAKAYIDFLKGPQGQKIAEENGFIPVEYSATSVAVQTNQTSGKENQPSAKKQPGFELTFALAGLLGVSCILHRRKV